MENGDRSFNQRAIRWGIVLFVVVVVTFGLLWVLKSALTPLAVAFLLAYLLDPLIDRLEAYRIPRPAAIVLLLAAWGAAVVVFMAFLIPIMQKEVATLAQQLPAYLDTALGVLGSYQQSLGITFPGNLQEALEQLKERGTELPLGWIRSLLANIAGLFSNTVGMLVGLIVIPVIAFYFLVDFDRLQEQMFGYVPPRYREYAAEKGRQVDHIISSFIRGQLTVCAILGILYAVGYLAIGIHLAIVIGLIGGMIAIIPYVGSAVAVFSASAICLLQYGIDVRIVLVVGWYTIVQSLEGYILTPRIVGHSLGLHPVAVIVALLIGGDLLGFLGLLIAVPAAAVVKVFVSEALAAYRASSVYTG
jgi:predicted PurR-regulated permease PerM